MIITIINLGYMFGCDHIIVSYGLTLLITRIMQCNTKQIYSVNSTNSNIYMAK